MTQEVNVINRINKPAFILNKSLILNPIAVTETLSALIGGYRRDKSIYQ